MSSSTSRVGSFVPSQNYGRVSRYRSVSTHFNLVFDSKLNIQKYNLKPVQIVLGYTLKKTYEERGHICNYIFHLQIHIQK